MATGEVGGIRTRVRSRESNGGVRGTVRNIAGSSSNAGVLGGSRGLARGVDAGRRILTGPSDVEVGRAADGGRQCLRLRNDDGAVRRADRDSHHIGAATAAASGDRKKNHSAKAQQEY